MNGLSTWERKGVVQQNLARNKTDGDALPAFQAISPKSAVNPCQIRPNPKIELIHVQKKSRQSMQDDEQRRIILPVYPFLIRAPLAALAASMADHRPEDAPASLEELF